MNLNSDVAYFLIEVNQFKLEETSKKVESNNLLHSYSPEYAGFIIINNLNNTQSWSTHFYRTLGLRPNEITPSIESLEKILHPGDYAVFENIIKENNKNLNKDLSIKVRYKTKNKTYVFLNTRVKVISRKDLKN